MGKVIGIDISKQSFDVAIIEGQQKAVSLRFENNGKGFSQLLKYLDKDSFVVMEATGVYYLRLAHFLYEHKIKVSVVNPLVVRRYAQMKMARAKTDSKDAVMIAMYAKSEQPESWQPDEETIARLRQIQTTLEQIDKQSTAITNSLEALNQLPLKEKRVEKSLKNLLSNLEREKKALEEIMEELIKQHYNDTFIALNTIPGIGKKTASMLITITNNFNNFSHYKQLISYVGLSPRIFLSGTSVKGKGHICKMGMSSIRKLLYMCSWSAKRYNSFCMELYTRLKEKGKPERVIKIAIANKLLRQAFAVAKNLTPFDKNYQPKLGF